jgi:hypothetical protein
MEKRQFMEKNRLGWIITGLDFEKLTEWEEEFVESMERHFKDHGALTKKQEDILERIYRDNSR